MATPVKQLKGLCISPEVTKYSEIQTSEFKPDEELNYLKQLAELLNGIDSDFLEEFFNKFLEPSKKAEILNEIKKELLDQGLLDSNDPLSKEDLDMYEKLNGEQLLTKLESLLKEADVFSEDQNTTKRYGTVKTLINNYENKVRLARGGIQRRIQSSGAVRAAFKSPLFHQPGGFRKTNKRQNKGRKRVSKRKSKK